jgi:hypothetical protein
MPVVSMTRRVWPLVVGTLLISGSQVSGAGTTRHHFPRVGTCYQTTVARTGGRFHWNERPPLRTDPHDDELVVEYADGHVMLDWEFNFRVSQWRRGDRVRLCVVSLPRNCPPGDFRGVEYRARNARTGEVWRSGDSAHVCGGA